MKKGFRNNEGYTLIEMIIAIAILALGLMTIIQTYQVGIVQLSTFRLRQQVAECGRLTMEYLNSIPSDVVYYIAPGSASAQFSYDTSDSYTDISAYVSNSMPICADLSANGNVQLKYQLCNGCSRYLPAANLAADPTGDGSRCVYDIAVRLIWSDAQGGGDRRQLVYRYKGYSNIMNRCNKPGACGIGTDPESVLPCSFPNL